MSVLDAGDYDSPWPEEGPVSHSPSLLKGRMVQSTPSCFRQRVLFPVQRTGNFCPGLKSLFPDSDAQEAGDTAQSLSGGLALQRTESQAYEEPGHLPGCSGELDHISWAPGKMYYFFSPSGKGCQEESMHAQQGANYRCSGLQGWHSSLGPRGGGVGEGQHQFPCLSLYHHLQRG